MAGTLGRGVMDDTYLQSYLRYRDEHTVIEGNSTNDWIKFKPFTVTKEIVKNHDDGKAWLVACNGIRRFCKQEKHHPRECTDYTQIKSDVEVKVNGEKIEISDLPGTDAGAKKHTV